MTRIIAVLLVLCCVGCEGSPFRENIRKQAQLDSVLVVVRRIVDSLDALPYRRDATSDSLYAECMIILERVSFLKDSPCSK